MKFPCVRLDEVAEVTAGNPAPQEPFAFSDNGSLFIRMQDVGRAHRTSSLLDSVDKVSDATIETHRLRLFPGGSILIPKSGASVNLNHRAMLGCDAYVVSHLSVIIPNLQRILPDYLYYWSLSYDPRSQAQTTSLPSLPLSLIKAASIPVPPISEQRRIVDLFSRAEGIVRLRRDAEKTAAELIPALFIDMFGDPATNPKGWPIDSLGDVLDSADYGSSSKASDDADGMPMIRMGNVSYAGNLDLTDLKYIVLPADQVERYHLKYGDILFNRTNSKDLVGKTGLWKGAFEAIAASYFIRLRVRAEVVCPDYVWAFMNSGFMKRKIFSTARGAIGQSNINSKELRAFALPIPPLPLQRKFAQRCDDIAALVAQEASASTKAQATFDALLAQVFGSNIIPNHGNEKGA